MPLITATEGASKSSRPDGVRLEDPARELGLALLEVSQELGDVGAHAEDVLAARQQHAAQALLRAQVRDSRLERGERHGVELVDRLARQVEPQLGQTVRQRQHLEGLTGVAHEGSSGLREKVGRFILVCP
jgi:hypothetical protein